MTLKDFLKAYADDLKYWTTLEVQSVNSITAGTPAFSNSEELEEYRKELDILIKGQEDE
tara:strand:- start:3043 stop:3219 length:177 start_codon:yes stop_codon:yes gene_type:complete